MKGLPSLAKGLGGISLVLVWAAGCAGPGPRLAPLSAVSSETLPDGAVVRWYDMDGNGSADFRETLSPAGRVERIGYDRDEDGRLDEEIALADVPAGQRHHLLVILDSVPISMAREAWDQGRLRYFDRPSCVISPFPVMTDPALTEFFGRAPINAVESAYYDGRHLVNGYDTYAHDGNTPWHADVDYYLDPVMHTVAYLWQEAWFGHELRRIQEVYARRDAQGERLTVAYVVGTSALGARVGRDGHVVDLTILDQFCREMVYESKGRACLSVMSDHGHNLKTSRHIRLGDELTSLGYRVTDRIEGPADVVIPEFGMVTCAAIHTRRPARVAADVVGLEGVELTAYREGATAQTPERVIVLSRAGRAVITRRGERFCYRCELGDPLQLHPILDQLAQAGKVDPDGFIADSDLFQATQSHIYPDGVQRLWRAFHGLFVHQPEVFVSIEDGYQVGSPLMSSVITLRAAHGNLRPLGSRGMAVSMAGPLPEVVRMKDLREAFRMAGVPFMSDSSLSQ